MHLPGEKKENTSTGNFLEIFFVYKNGKDKKKGSTKRIWQFLKMEFGEIPNGKSQGLYLTAMELAYTEQSNY